MFDLNAIAELLSLLKSNELQTLAALWVSKDPVGADFLERAISAEQQDKSLVDI